MGSFRDTEIMYNSDYNYTIFLPLHREGGVSW